MIRAHALAGGGSEGAGYGDGVFVTGLNYGGRSV